jgi:hypothetical protein
MRRPTETALRSRARALLEAMTDRGRWIYAVPRDDGPAAVREVALAAGFTAPAADAPAARYEKGAAALVARDAADLDVLLVEATGEEAAALLGPILDKAGFYAQSTLLGTAFDVLDEEAPTALQTLAFMVVTWDADWRELFAGHLAAEDPVVRREAGTALTIAAATAGDPGPAAALLDEALGREPDAEVAAALTAARAALGAPAA